jgi:hypothetical protein
VLQHDWLRRGEPVQPALPLDVRLPAHQGADVHVLGHPGEGRGLQGTRLERMFWAVTEQCWAERIGRSFPGSTA